MDEHEENFKDIFRYTDVEYTPDGYTDVYRWDDFLVIAGDHVYSAMDTIDSVSSSRTIRLFPSACISAISAHQTSISAKRSSPADIPPMSCAG